MKYLPSFLSLIFVLSLRFHIRSFEFPQHLHTVLPKQICQRKATHLRRSCFLCSPARPCTRRCTAGARGSPSPRRSGSWWRPPQWRCWGRPGSRCEALQWNFYNLSKPSNSQLLQRFKDNISTFILYQFSRNSCTSIASYLNFCENVFDFPFILFINKPMNHRQANKLTIIFYWNFKISKAKDALYINSCMVEILLPATLR